MSLCNSPRRSWILLAMVIAPACQSQVVAVNPNDPEIAATVEAILDKAVAAAGAADAEAVLSASTKDDTFTFITDDTMLQGYDEALAAFRRRTRCYRGRPTRLSRGARACCHRMSSSSPQYRRGHTPTRPGSRPCPLASVRRPCSSGATGSGGSSTSINQSPNSGSVCSGRSAYGVSCRNDGRVAVGHVGVCTSGHAHNGSGSQAHAGTGRHVHLSRQGPVSDQQ